MKKDRNAFFNEGQFSNYSYYPNQMPVGQPMPQMYQQQMPVQASQASMNSYAGPMPMNYQGNMVNNQASLDTDYETRIGKLERQVNKLDARISKLENNANPITYNQEQSSSSLYMV